MVADHCLHISLFIQPGPVQIGGHFAQEESQSLQGQQADPDQNLFQGRSRQKHNSGKIQIAVVSSYPYWYQQGSPIRVKVLLDLEV